MGVFKKSRLFLFNKYTYFVEIKTIKNYCWFGRESIQMYIHTCVHVSVNYCH